MVSENTNFATDFEAGKQAALDGDIDKARELLRPLAEQHPHHSATFFLCQVEATKGSIVNCEKYHLTFLSKHPRHAGMRTISALINIARGDLDQAEKDLNIALATKPHHTRALRTLEQIKVMRLEAEIRQAIAILEPRQTTRATPQPQKIEAAMRLKKVPPINDWDKHAMQAKIAFFHNCQDVRRALSNFDAEFIESAVELGYCTWPRKIESYVRGRRVLDVGCGFGGYAVGYLCAGAQSYTGADPAMSLDTKRMRNKRVRKWVNMPWSARDIMTEIPDIELFQGSTRDLVGSRTFDVICLHNVTEHLLEIESVFHDISALLAKGGKVIFLHHNFYGWSGHHMPPHHPSIMDENNPEHMKFCDWKHINIVNQLPRDHYLHTNLNRIRIEELHELTQKFFRIEAWENRNSPAVVLERLTSQIVERVRVALPNISKSELEANAVFCVASKK